MVQLIIPLLVFYSNNSQLKELDNSIKFIERSCNISFLLEIKKRSFNYEVFHAVLDIKKFNYYKEITKDNYRVYMTGKEHRNFSYNNSAWISNQINETSISHEIIHMITGEKYHEGINHILSPYEERKNKIKKSTCLLVKKNLWKIKNNFLKDLIF